MTITFFYFVQNRFRLSSVLIEDSSKINLQYKHKEIQYCSGVKILMTFKQYAVISVLSSSATASARMFEGSRGCGGTFRSVHFSFFLADSSVDSRLEVLLLLLVSLSDILFWTRTPVDFSVPSHRIAGFWL